MSDTTGIVREQLLLILDEAFPHPSKQWTYFTDDNPDSGLFGMLTNINAEEASKVIGSSSIAANVYHIIFSIYVSAKWISGDNSPVDWNKSWELTAADKNKWREIQEELKISYQKLRSSIETADLSKPEITGGAIGTLAHVAYHMGSIKQKIIVVKQG